MLFPDITWYEKGNNIYINFNHFKFKEEKLTVTKDKIDIYFEEDGMDIGCKLDLYKNIDETSVKIKKNKCIQIICKKLDIVSWPQLTKVVNKFIKIDWGHWRETNKKDLGLKTLINDCFIKPDPISEDELDQKLKTMIDNFECSDSETE